MAKFHPIRLNFKTKNSLQLVTINYENTVKYYVCILIDGHLTYLNQENNKKIFRSWKKIQCKRRKIIFKKYLIVR